MTPLHSTLKRALTIDGRDYVLTLTETALKLTLKGKRNGVELPWSQLVNGEAALAVALHASLGAFAKKDKGLGAEQGPSAKSPAAAKAPAAAKPSFAAKSSPRAKPKRRTPPARKK
ncbi:MAG TPA: hypothetical protein VK580_02000 [Steroidobacteraceae bacterium]|jgi:hypothetical protein|nr:hypothetical protein [Steroidobacteraceae bacterium]